MAEPTQYTLTHKEILRLIVENCGVTEGRWILLANFGFSPGNFGPTEEAMNPGTVVVLASLGIQRETKDMGIPPSGLVIDAAELNSRSKPTRSTARKSDKS